MTTVGRGANAAASVVESSSQMTMEVRTVENGKIFPQEIKVSSLLSLKVPFQVRGFSLASLFVPAICVCKITSPPQSAVLHINGSCFCEVDGH